MKTLVCILPVLLALADPARAGLALSGEVDFAIQNVDAEWQAGSAGTGRNQLSLDGHQDLAEGLQVVTHLQLRHRLSDGTFTAPGNHGSVAARSAPGLSDAHIGLEAPWGKLRMGRLAFPMTRLNVGFEPFGGDTLASVNTEGIRATVRANGAIAWRSPAWAGLQAEVALAGRKGQIPTGQKGMLPAGLGLHWRGEALELAAAYDQNAESLRNVGLYAACRLRADLRVMAQVEQGDLSPFNGQQLLRASTGVNLALGALLLRAGYLHRPDEDITKLGLGADYALLPTTGVYGDISRQRGSGNATTGLITGLQRRPRLEVGLRHRF